MDGRDGDVCVEERAGAGGGAGAVAPAAAPAAVVICGLKVGVARVYPGIGGGYNCLVLLGEWRGFFVYFGVDCSCVVQCKRQMRTLSVSPNQ